MRSKAKAKKSPKRVVKVGQALRKLQPKLRVYANGDTDVNVIRAERCPSIAVKSARVAASVPLRRGRRAAPVKYRPEVMRRGSLHVTSKDVLASVFVSMTDERRATRFPGEMVRKGNIAAATVTLAQLKKIAKRKDVAYVEAGEQLVPPRPVASSHEGVAAPPPSLRRIGSSPVHRDGARTLIGIIDVEGFDFAHPDVLDGNGNTRFVRIWDQGGDARPSPQPFDYGAEFRREHLNAAIHRARDARVAPQDLERQSQMASGSHGTHVASIAAGNRGICRRAPIAGVLIDLPTEDFERRRSFYDSTRIAHAVDYLLALGQELDLPVSINISLGTNGHAHDASAAVSRWIDAALATPGRSVCIAAGNAGQEAPEEEGDIGWVMGRVHTSGRIPAAGADTVIEWNVVGNTIADVSENELELWYSPQDRFAVSLKPPGGAWIGPVRPGEFIENRQLPDGTLFSIYNELYHHANGSNYISVYLSPFFSSQGVVGVRAGQWLVRLHGEEVRDGSYHGWIERDDPQPRGRAGPKEAWSFPSFFSERSNVDRSSVSSLACGHWSVSIANLDENGERVNITSSQGPTRDERTKPEIAAPGTNIVAADGFSDPDHPWISMTGTSMASPYVAGVIGLMLSMDRRLTAAQIGGIIKRTARSLPGSDFTWRDSAGFGAIDPEACLREAAAVNRRTDITG